MSDDISKKVLLEVDLASQDSETKISSLKDAVNDLATAAGALKKVTQNAQEATNAYSEKIAQSKLNVQQMREETARLSEAKKQEAIAIKGAKDATVAAAGSYKEAQQSLTKLGNAIKNTENGFKSTDPELKKQIASYNKLNGELKKFDAQMGVHTRNVGNYTGALQGITGAIEKIVPSFGQFSGILQGATSSFSAMGAGTEKAASGLLATGEAAGGAEVATGALGLAALGLTAGFAAVAAVGVGVINYFKDIATFSDKLSNAWAGAGATWTAFVQTIGDGDFGNLEKNMEHARDRAKELNQAMIDLKRNALVSEVEKNAENEFIATQMLKMRNLHTSSAEAEKIFSEVQETANRQFNRVSKEAEQGYNIVANKIALTARLTKEELTELARDGVAAAEVFKKEGKHISDDLIAEFAQFQTMRASAQGIKDQVEQRAQNREDQRIARNEKAAAAALTKEQKEEQKLAEIKRATEEANSERVASIARTFAFQQQAFAKELSSSDEHYRQLIFKQKEFIKKQEEIVHSVKATPKEKAAAKKGITAGQMAIGALTDEHAANQKKIIEDHHKVLIDEAQKSANDLSQIQIQSIDDVQERERQSENLAFKEKTQAADKEIALIKENQGKLSAEMETATPERLKILKAEYKHEHALLENAEDKKTEIILAHNKKALEDIKRFSDEKQAIIDQTEVLKAENVKTGSDKSLLEAQQKQLLDQYNADVSVKGLTDERKLQLEREYLNKRDGLNADYSKKTSTKELQLTREIANSAFNIIEQSMQRSNQAAEMNMQRQKDHDLQNQALTNTQKYAINEKYRVLEGKQKQKEFKQEQEIKIAQAIVNGGLAILEAFATLPTAAALAMEPFIIATTAVNVATIAAQKAPAYALGGLHYSSDGKGGVLPGYSKQDNTNAYLRSGEAVVVSEAMRDPWARNIVSAINQSYGGRSFDSTVPVNPWPGFASGGVFSNYLPTGDNGLRPNVSSVSSNRIHPDDINGIAAAVSSIKFPPIITDIKDVNNQNQILSNVNDRRTY